MDNSMVLLIVIIVMVTMSMLGGLGYWVMTKNSTTNSTTPSPSPQASSTVDTTETESLHLYNHQFARSNLWLGSQLSLTEFLRSVVILIEMILGCSDNDENCFITKSKIDHAVEVAQGTLDLVIKHGSKASTTTTSFNNVQFETRNVNEEMKFVAIKAKQYNILQKLGAFVFNVGKGQFLHHLSSNMRNEYNVTEKSTAQFKIPTESLASWVILSNNSNGDESLQKLQALLMQNNEESITKTNYKTWQDAMEKRWWQDTLEKIFDVNVSDNNIEKNVDRGMKELAAMLTLTKEQYAKIAFYLF